MKRIPGKILSAALLAATAACSDGPNAPGDIPDDLPSGVVVSNARSGIVYVSAVPGTFQATSSISLGNETNPSTTVTTTLRDGGFDPIAVNAKSGDRVSLTALSPAGAVSVYGARVSEQRSPSIVRTNPHGTQTGVAINEHPYVVFSEPVDISTVTPASFTLAQNGGLVSGAVTVSEDRLTVGFTPNASLETEKTYLLEVKGVRDSDGDVLTTNPVVSFTTLSSTAPGSIEITVVTSGPDPDTDGYFLSETGARTHQGGRVAVNSTTTLTSEEQGSHELVLYGLAPNCTLAGDNPRTIDVRRGEIVRLAYGVTCVAAGSLRVTTVTTGVEIDDSGYQMFDRNRAQFGSDLSHSFTSGLDVFLESNGTRTVPALPAGNFTVDIGMIAPNCTLLTPTTQSIAIAAGVETPLRLEVRCVEPFQIAFVGGLNAEESNFDNTDIYLIYASGRGAIRLTSDPGADLQPSWSPDGEKIVFASDRAGNREIYVMNRDGSNAERLTDNPALDYLPAFSPDGKRIAFVSTRSGNADIYVMNADGTSAIRLTSNSADESDPAWSPDGSRIAFSRGGHIYLMNGDGTAELKLTSIGVNSEPAWSPDGKTIAFLSEGRTAYKAVYLMNADGSNVRRILGVGYDTSSPDWSPDGRSIAFDDWDCWDSGPCPRGIIIGTFDGIYSIGINNAAQPAWRPR